MLAFVLGLAFTPRFATLTGTELGLYIATLVLGAIAASLLMSPAALNRLVFRRQLRRRLISAANRLALFGLASLLAALGCAIMLVLFVVLHSSALATIITTLVIGWFIVIWFAVPAWWRYQHRECGSHAPGSHAPGSADATVTALVPRRAQGVELSWTTGLRDGLRSHWRMTQVRTGRSAHPVVWRQQRRAG
jgi:hypothetical protein